jgi:hypothetical protein
MRDTSQTLPVELLLVQFLEWVAARPRCYADVQEAWRTSCPRLPVWEAAVDGELVRIDHASARTMGDCAVALTEQGREALLEASSHGG